MYKDKEAKDGRLLKFMFGLPFLSPAEVKDCLFDDLMALKPVHEKFDAVFDHLLDKYVTPESVFPPSMGRNVQQVYNARRTAAKLLPVS